MKKFWKWQFVLLLCVMLTGCGAGKMPETEPVLEEAALEEETPEREPETASGEAEDSISGRKGESEPAQTIYGKARQSEPKGMTGNASAAGNMTYIDIPVYTGEAYTEINGNVPWFSEEDMTDVSFEYYSDLDALERCGACMASVGQDIMPTVERGDIGDVRPTGWHTVKYEGIVDGNYLYNRCHLLGFQLTGENANRKNLITGTRYMNVEGMLPFENMVADYVKETGNHVMYRVTPLFEGDNLVADGVLMEAKSVEDDGEDILFNVFCYNVQPGISIDYATGESWPEESADAPVSAPERSGKEAQRQESMQSGMQEQRQETQVGLQESQQEPAQPEIQEPQTQQPASAAGSGAYAVNARNGKIHIVGACPATGSSSKAMSEPVYFDTYEEAEAYSTAIAPGENKRKCGNCW